MSLMSHQPDRSYGDTLLKFEDTVRLMFMLHETIRNDDFSATRRCNIVATVFRMVTTLFQHCSALLS